MEKEHALWYHTHVMPEGWNLKDMVTFSHDSPLCPRKQFMSGSIEGKGDVVAKKLEKRLTQSRRNELNKFPQPDDDQGSAFLQSEDDYGEGENRGLEAERWFGEHSYL